MRAVMKCRALEDRSRDSGIDITMIQKYDWRSAGVPLALKG